MANFIDYITAKAQSLYYNERLAEKTEAPFLGDELFPTQRKQGLTIEWIKGLKGGAQVLPLSAFDAKVLKLSRMGFTTVNQKMPFFKASLDIDEELRQKLLMLGESQVQFIQQIIAKVFDDNSKLIEAAAVTRERMRMQLLTTGAIRIESNGQAYLFDYGLEEYQKQTVKKSWSDPTADIIGDIQAYQDEMVAKTGVKPTRLVMRNSQFRNMMKNDYIKNALYVFGQGKVNASQQAVRTFLNDQLGITSIAVYDKAYIDEEGKTQFFIPDDVVVLIPEGNIGYTWMGTTPEEADLLGSNATDAQVSIVDNGVAVTVMKEKDPVRTVTKVSQICIPSGENMDKVVIIDTTAA